ncbi:MAG: hypothetical protein ACKOW9_06280 [Candidatus Paceibacterota bacterium]
MSETVIRIDKIAELPDSVLHYAYKNIQNEINLRKIASNDLNFLLEDGFASGFNIKGLPNEPRLINGLLLATGSKIDKNKTSHICAFVKINDKWVWESEMKVIDEIRQIPSRVSAMRTVTVTTLNEDDKVDLIECNFRNGVHRLKSVESYLLQNNELKKVSSRITKMEGHR